MPAVHAAAKRLDDLDVAVDPGHLDAVRAQAPCELVDVRHHGEQHVVGRVVADRAPHLAVLLQPAEQHRRVGEAMAGAQRVDHDQADRVARRVPAQQRQDSLGVRLDVVAEPPGHLAKARGPT